MASGLRHWINAIPFSKTSGKMVHSGFQESPQPIRTPKGFHSGLLSSVKALRPQRGRGRKARLRTSSSSSGSGTTEPLRQVATWRMNTKTRGLPQPRSSAMQQGKGAGSEGGSRGRQRWSKGATPGLAFPPRPCSHVPYLLKPLDIP